MLSDIVKRGSCRSFAVTQVMRSEQCLRLQPQADILEAHDNARADVRENESLRICPEYFVTAPKARCWFDPEK